MPQTAVKLPTPIVEHARAAAKLHSRSISGQVEHWVRIGRAIEQSKSYDLERIEAALRAEFPYDDLNADEAAIYRDRFTDALLAPSKEIDDIYAELGRKADAFDARNSDTLDAAE